MKILITAGTTTQAHKLKRLLDKEETFIFADQEIPAFVSSSFRFIQIPQGDSFSFAHELLKNCLDEEVDCVFPLRKAEILSLAEAVQLFEEYGVKVVVPVKEKLSVLMSAQPVIGSLTVFINGSVYAAEDKNTVFSESMHDGVFVTNPEKEADHYIFTAD